MRYLAMLIVVLPSVLPLVGCAYRGPQTSVAQVSADQYDSVYRASVATLRRFGFTVNRQDYRFGRVEAQPLGAPSVVEAWRPTRSTGDQALRATFNDHRRTAVVMLDPVGSDSGQVDLDSGQVDLSPPALGDPNAYHVRVEVFVERRHTPVRRIVGPRSGPVMYELDAVPHELAERGIEARYWTPAGRDPALEQKLLRAILHRADNPPPRL